MEPPIKQFDLIFFIIQGNDAWLCPACMATTTTFQIELNICI
uniref:Uncharacterized protein n=1 Tax=Rhizophora mucronata TaxID=61149 RepID=A0A2P2P6M3_RHIMU